MLYAFYIFVKFNSLINLKKKKIDNYFCNKKIFNKKN